MADIAKTVQVVSPRGVSVCELTSTVDTANRSDSFSDLSFNLPSSDEGTSLQELIESELALRISGDKLESERADADDEHEEQLLDFSQPEEQIQSSVPNTTQSQPQQNFGEDELDINTQFLIAERNSAFQSYSGNADLFFFSTLDDAQISGAETFPKFDQEEDASPEALPPPLTNEFEIDSPPETFETVEEDEVNAYGNLSKSECLANSAGIKAKLDLGPMSSFDPFATIELKSESNDTLSSPSACLEADNLPHDNGDFAGTPVDVIEEEDGLGAKIGDLVDFQDDDDDDGVVVDSSECNVEELAYDRVDDCMTQDTVLLQFDETDRCDTAQHDTVCVSVATNSMPSRPIIPQIDIIPPDDMPEGEFDPWTTVIEETIDVPPELQMYPEPEPELEPASAPEPSELQPELVELVPKPESAFDTEPGVELAAEAAAVLGPESESHPEPVPEPETETQHGLCCDSSASYDSSESSEIVSSSTSEKRTVKKKKSEGGETKTKKTKKTKKSDSEKENISVTTNVPEPELTLEEPDANHSSVCQEEEEIPISEGSIIDDDLSNVSVKSLKSAYSSQKHTLSPRDVPKEIDEDILHCGSIKSLKETYCSEATKSFGRMESSDGKKRIATGVSIKDLRRSFGDLTQICAGEDEDEACNDPSTPEVIIVPPSPHRSLSQSPFGRINAVAKVSAGWPPVTSSDTPARETIHTGVSVKHLKSSFSKFDQLSKKTVLHVRSVDASKVQKQFNQTAASAPEQTSNCRSCGKQVFQMEQVKAERAVWHKNCFRCKECNKQLTVDIYSSNEGQLYCKPHFRELFKPKAVLDNEDEPPRRRKHEMIIRESQPVELPPEVVRASDKPDLGLEELSSLNVKSRFQVFEKTEPEVERSPSSVSVKRSPSILSKLARFQAKGMDVGVTDDSLNGIPYEETSSSSEAEEEDEDGEENGDVVRASRKHRERPVSFGKMEDMKCKWETGQTARREVLREERKHEISTIRSRLFMGHQGKMKEMYEQAVLESERNTQKKEEVDVCSDKARNIKECFERGETLPDGEGEEGEGGDKRANDEDFSVFEAGISKKSRSLFLELDATAAKTQQVPMSPVKVPASSRDDSRKLFLSRQASEDVVKCTDTVEDVQVETADVINKFKFFETYKTPDKERKKFRITPPRDGQVKVESPDREIYRDPNVVRAEDKLADEEVIRTNTASKMLSIFRQMEENATKEELPEGPKPLKRFTPPPDYTRDSESEEEETDSEEEENDEEEEEEHEEVNPNIIRASDKIEDEFLKQAQTAARAKALRAKFERWEEKENKANSTNGGSLNGLDIEQSEQASIDTTKSLRARFESLKNETQQPKERTPRPKVNRFVEIQINCAEFCSSCEKKVYPLEKVETGGKIFHKQCFRCLQCNCVLRMDTYTLNNGQLYCMPHFKQLFIAKGNYEEGFGLDQHKRKWNNPARNSDDILLNGVNGGDRVQ